jgi:hypothetical protein
VTRPPAPREKVSPGARFVAKRWARPGRVVTGGGIREDAPVTCEREIDAPIELCLPDGRLNRAAVGWTRRPLHRANLRGWGRNKRWEYWGVVTPSHVVAVTVSSLDYAGVSGIYVLDRSRGEELVREAITPLARGVVLPDRCGGGPVRAEARGLRIAIDEREEGTSLYARAADLEVALTIARPAGHEALGVVVPWSERLFQYTVKDLARPARGRLTIRGREHEVAGETAFAVLDHGRGRWPYAKSWNWAAGCGRRDGLALAIQLGGKWTDGTGSTENALLLGGRLHKIGEDLEWSYDRGCWTRPWRIAGARVDVKFEPFHERRARTNLGIVASEIHQCFGRFTGWASTDEGDRVSLDGLVGWAEEARNRW